MELSRTSKKKQQDSRNRAAKAVERALASMESNALGQYLLTPAQIEALVEQESKRANRELQTKVDVYEQEKLVSANTRDVAYTSRFEEINSAVRYHSEVDAKAIIDARNATISALRRLLDGTPSADLVVEAQRQASFLEKQLLVMKQSLQVQKEEHHKVMEACNKKVAEARAVSDSTIDSIHELHELHKRAEQALATRTNELEEAKKRLADANTRYKWSCEESERFRNLSTSYGDRIIDLEKTIKTMEEKNKEENTSVAQKKRKTDNDAVPDIDINNTAFAIRPAARPVPTVAPPMSPAGSSQDTSADVSMHKAPATDSKKRCPLFAKGNCRRNNNCRLGAHE